MDAEKEPRQVIKNRSRKAQRIDPVKDARVAHDQRSIVPDTPIPLDRAHGHSA
jgi:hypothetical protein